VLLSWFLHSEKLKFTAKKMPDEVSGHQSGERSQPSTLATPSLKLAVSQRGKGKGQRESVFHGCFSRSDLFTPTNQRSHSWSSRTTAADHEVFPGIGAIPQKGFTINRFVTGLESGRERCAVPLDQRRIEVQKSP